MFKNRTLENEKGKKFRNLKKHNVAKEFKNTTCYHDLTNVAKSVTEIYNGDKTFQLHQLMECTFLWITLNWKLLQEDWRMRDKD